MAMNDPVADLLTRIRNGSRARHLFVQTYVSKLELELIKVLKKQGMIRDFEQKESEVRIYLKYAKNPATSRLEPVIHGLQRVSSPGCRRYVGYKNIPYASSEWRMSILSTPSGVMVGKEAKEAKVGGELLCYVW
jgi:small subunit ribosomal protein S8